MVSAETGWTARAKPAARLVTTKPRRVSAAGGKRLIRWLSRSSIGSSWNTLLGAPCWLAGFQPGPSLEPSHDVASDSHEDLWSWRPPSAWKKGRGQKMETPGLPRLGKPESRASKNDNKSLLPEF